MKVSSLWEVDKQDLSLGSDLDITANYADYNGVDGKDKKRDAVIN